MMFNEEFEIGASGTGTVLPEYKEVTMELSFWLVKTNRSVQHEFYTQL